MIVEHVSAPKVNTGLKMINGVFLRGGHETERERLENICVKSAGKTQYMQIYAYKDSVM